MTTPNQKTGGWEEEFMKFQHYINCFYAADGVCVCVMKLKLDFIHQLIAAKIEEAKKEMEKAFGGCKNCYGKGYATTIEFAQSCEDFGGEKIIRVKMPEMRFCSCERGKELKKRFEAAKKEERDRILTAFDEKTRGDGQLIVKEIRRLIQNL